MLRAVNGGEYAGESLLSHVGLGGSLLLATDQRLLYMRKGTWELYWQVPLDYISDVLQRAGSSEVVIQLVEGASSAEANGPPMLSIDCMTPAVVPLVMDTVQRAIESAAEAGSAPLRKEA